MVQSASCAGACCVTGKVDKKKICLHWKPHSMKQTETIQTCDDVENSQRQPNSLWFDQLVHITNPYWHSNVYITVCIWITEFVVY